MRQASLPQGLIINISDIRIINYNIRIIISDIININYEAHGLPFVDSDFYISDIIIINYDIRINNYDIRNIEI